MAVERGAGQAARTGLRVGDLLDDKLFAEKLKRRLEENNAVLKSLGAKPIAYRPVLASYLAAARELRPFVTNTVVWLHDAIRKAAAEPMQA